MPRRPCCRRVRGSPGASTFQPSGPGVRSEERIVMTLDEFEAIRLAHLEGLYHEPAAGRMGVSRTTFGRILDSANRKIAEVLVHGRPLSIGGGPVSEVRPRTVHCPRCDHPWRPTRQRAGTGRCPRCRRGKTEGGSEPELSPHSRPRKNQT